MRRRDIYRKLVVLVALIGCLSLTASATAMNVDWNSAEGRYQITGGSLDSDLNIIKVGIMNAFFYSGADEIHASTTGVRCGTTWAVGQPMADLVDAMGASDWVTCASDRDVLASLGGGDDNLTDILDRASIDYIIDAGTGTDTITTSDGNDRIDVSDRVGYHDTVSCGPGTDSVRANSDDTVAADCETVTVTR